MSKSSPSFAVMGTGGVGGYFGARLAASGARVAFIARGAHLAAMRETGLRVRSVHGDVTIDPVEASDDPAAVGPVDVVLFTVKLYDTETAGAALAPMIGDDTAVLSLQNGVEAEEQLAALVGREHVMGGVAQIAAVIEEPGVIRQTSPFHRMIFGELDGHASARAEALLAACEAAHIDAVLSRDIDRDIWLKFVVLASLSGVTSVTRSTVGSIREDPDTRALLEAALTEAAQVARAKGVDLEDDVVARQLGFIDTFDVAMKSSMQQDLERGNRLELDNLSGAVVRMGAALGIDTPVHRAVYAALKLHAGGAAASA